MKKGIFKELVLLKLTGGVLTDESTFKREDIDAYIPASINWAMAKTYNVNLKQEGDRDFPSVFFGEFTETISRATRIPSITLPKGVMPMYGNQGLRYIKDNCGHTYSPLSDSDMHTVEHYDDMLIGSKWFRLKGNNRVDLYGLSPIIKTLYGEYLVKIEDLDDEDELPIQGGMEVEAIQVCVEFFTGQRQLADRRNNKADINTSI